ncbi:geranylgeranylglycerol-phosphate geranylgeranyltransferase [Flavobacterium sp. WW92]|uniref:geranylgeranylglycerol-phosphate geranylgeranyltransferase n=1 Tax=unclassified Flavobacterium TaxID=196869 RepID=UPI002224B92B|nr:MULTISPECIES: geranylgeranylglycerol-phosphate geranylgeranyltransferase [unclassified Flavobacterium]WDO11799.1 geranylgeranylglycerol-phosphate geranylgeranyltransferase [Flavobacterium sp. WW92]
MSFLKLIRYQNLILLALMQLVFRYGFLESQSIPLALNDWQFALLVFSTVCIAAGGYLINNIFDRGTDEINKPQDVVIGKQISESMGCNIYIALNVVGVGIGFYLANAIHKSNFAAVFIIIAATLYVYANGVKQTLLIGNIIIALLLSLSILIIGIFDLLPMIVPENQANMGVIFGILIDYAVFAFIINFIREIVKDLEDVNGDYNQGMNTLPIVLGVARTAKVVLGLSFIPLGLIIYYINEHLFSNNLYYASGYGFVFILAPLIYFTVKMFGAKNQKDFHHLSKVLKLVIFFGILSIAVINFNIKYA